MKKKNMVLVALLAMLVGLCAYGTVAYFAGEAHVTNVITTGTVDVKLVETKADGSPWEDVNGVVAGEVVDKHVWVENTGTADAWVRVQVITSAVSADGSQELSDTVIDKDFNLSPTEEGDTAYWVPGEGGWYYYSVPLAPGASTEKLFQNVTFDTSMGNAYQGAVIHVDVTAQAVQSKNNPIPTGGDVTDLVGWPTN